MTLHCCFAWDEVLRCAEIPSEQVLDAETCTNKDDEVALFCGLPFVVHPDQDAIDQSNVE